MRMLRTPSASGTSAQLTRDVFWELMKRGNISARDLVYDIGDTRGFPDQSKENYFIWRQNMKRIIRWIMDAKPDQMRNSTSDFLREMLWIAIEEDFNELRDFLWGKIPSLRSYFIGFTIVNRIVLMAKHFPEKLWERIQYHDPLDISGAMECAYAAAAARPMHIELVRYFGKYHDAERVLRLLNYVNVTKIDVDKAKELLRNPDIYVSANKNALYNWLTKNTGYVYPSVLNEKDNLIALVVNHPKFKMPPEILFKRIFKYNEQEVIETFVPRYSADDIYALLYDIGRNNIGFDFTEKRPLIERVIRSITPSIKNLNWDMRTMDIELPPWILEMLIERDIVDKITIFPEQVIQYIELHGIQNVPLFLNIVLFFNQPPVNFKHLLFAQVDKIVSMGPASNMLMRQVLKSFPEEKIEAMKDELKIKIRDTYHDDVINRLLWRNMEPEHKKGKK